MVCITIKSIIYGSSVFFTGRLTESTNVFDILAIRFLITFTILFILKKLKVLKINIEITGSIRNRNTNVNNLLLCALFEPILYMIFETLGISMTTGITAGIILALTPIIACLMEVVFLNEKGTFLKYVFIVIGMIGVLYITVKTDTTTGENTVFGIICMFLAVFSTVIYSVFARQLSRYYRPIEISYVTAGFGALVFNLINIIRHIYSRTIADYFKPLYNFNNIIGFIFLAIISSIIASAMGNYSLKKMQLSTSAAFGGLSTLVTILIGVFINNEHLYYYHYIGVFLILLRIVGIILIETKSEKRDTLAFKRHYKLRGEFYDE